MIATAAGQKVTMPDGSEGEEKPDSGTLKIGETVKLVYVDQMRSKLDPNKTVWEMLSGGADLIKLGAVNPNPALFDNHVHFYLAQELEATGKQHLDEDEFINCMELTKEEVLEGMGTPQFPHAIMGMALSLYIKHKGGRL